MTIIIKIFEREFNGLKGSRSETMVYEVEDEDDFRTQLSKAGSALVVAEFYGDFCHSSRKLKPVIAQLEQEFLGILFLKIDAEKFEDLTDEYDIRKLSTFLFIRDIKLLDFYFGSDVEYIRELIRKYK